MWGLAKNTQRVITFYFQSVISPHSAVNTRDWRECHWITSSHKKKDKLRFPKYGSHSVPMEANRVNRDQVMQRQSTPWTSDKDQSSQSPVTFTFISIWFKPTATRAAEERPPWYSTAWSPSLWAPSPFSLIRITVNHSEKRQSFQTWWQNHTTMWKEKATRRTQWEFTADWNNPHVVDWHSPKGEEKKSTGRENIK